MGRKKNELGNRYGKLLVIGEAPSKNSSAYWLCQCDCGKQITVRGSDLRYGRKSCGCISRENLKKYNENIFIDLTGQKFGYLTVLEKSAPPKNPNNKSTMWKCQCECGNIVNIQRANLLSGNSTSCGCKKMSHGEQKIKNILLQNNIMFEAQKSFDNCRFPTTNHLAIFDFYINKKYLIEYDGIQHFEATSDRGWNTKENLINTQQRDQFKNQWCKENNIPLIRIPYTHYNDLCLKDLIPETSQFLLK